MCLWHAGWALLPPLLSALPPERAQAFQSWVLRPFYPFPTEASSSLGGVGGQVFQESSVNVRAQEARVRVSLHEAVDDLLGVVKAVQGRGLDVPLDLLSGVIVNVDLERGSGKGTGIRLL